MIIKYSTAVDDSLQQTSPEVGLLRGLHPAAEVLQVKAHEVIEARHILQPWVQLVPVHLHLLPVHIAQCRSILTCSCAYPCKIQVLTMSRVGPKCAGNICCVR